MWHELNLLINDIEPCYCSFWVLFTSFSGWVWKCGDSSSFWVELRDYAFLKDHYPPRSCWANACLCVCECVLWWIAKGGRFIGASSTGLNDSHDNQVVGCHGSLILVSPLAHSHSTAVIAHTHAHRFPQANLPLPFPCLINTIAFSPRFTLHHLNLLLSFDPVSHPFSSPSFRQSLLNSLCVFAHGYSNFSS